MVTTVHVGLRSHPRGSRTGQWEVRCSRHGIVSTHRRKDVALREGRQHARSMAPAVLKVQNTSGQWATEATYA